jgi:16S rRNA processing protein RimM
MTAVSADSGVPADLLVVGRLTAVYGLKGWLKVYSYTEPMENIFEYKTCLVNRQGVWQPVEIEAGRPHGKGLVLKLRGVDNPELGASYASCDLAVPLAELPALPQDEYYWRQLVGLQVIVDHPERGRLALGRIDHLMETGANDVLVVRGDEQSIDRRERLIPYLPDRVVLEIDLAEQTMRVDWDPDF